MKANPKYAESIRQQLMSLRARLQGEMAERLGRGRGVAAGPADSADLAIRSTDCDLTMASMEVGSQELEQIESALQKIDDGEFGVCESCGDPIGSTRLRALPFATECIECKSAGERHLGYGPRGSDVRFDFADVTEDDVEVDPLKEIPDVDSLAN